MSRFLRHIPCPRCGSKDNLGEYDDHYFCFGCRYTTPKRDLASIRARLQKIDEIPQKIGELKITKDLPLEARQWLLKYGLTSVDADVNDFGWIEDEQILVLLHTEEYYQGRCFNPDAPAKYMSKGKKPIAKFNEGTKTAVLTEDVVSAVKVSKAGVTSIPLLGSTIPLEWILRLKSEFSEVIVWLDRDKAKNSLKIASEFRQRGIHSWSCITDKDPKEYSLQEIKQCLKKN